HLRRMPPVRGEATMIASPSGTPRVDVTTRPAPVGAAGALLRAADEPESFLWSDADGSTFVGIGCAARIRATGGKRFETVKQEAARLGPHGRIFGGFAFAPAVRRASLGPWDDFADAAFVVPRILYMSDGVRAWLTISASVSAAELRRLEAALEQPQPRLAPPAPSEPRSELSPAQWVELVGRAQRDIAAGRLRKVVVAQRSTVTARAGLDPLAVLERLRAAQPGCFHFAFRHPRACFLGASPERLVARSGAVVLTEALAGSMPSSRDA